jgi:tetratricopeptide (TPR) repeat protein
MSSGYHHGQTIRDFRLKQGWTVSQLAEHWPHGPVSMRYVQSVEAGDRHVADQVVLRGIARELNIPLWRFGLSEFDPFDPQQLPGHGEHLYDETLDAIEQLLVQTWYMRRATPVSEVAKSVRQLNTFFEYIRSSLPPAATQQSRFLRLLAQVHRLQAIVLLENQHYAEALAEFETMHRIATELNEPATLALALMGIGTELERVGNRERAITCLEHARDVSFDASKQIAVVVNAYLARVYASAGDVNRFMRAIDTAEMMARNLGDRHGDGTDYVYHRLSGVLAERSYGYLEVGEADKVLAMKTQVSLANDAVANAQLDAWITLDWARAHQVLGDLDESARLGWEFFQKAHGLKSRHAMNRALDHLMGVYESGYGDPEPIRIATSELASMQLG